MAERRRPAGRPRAAAVAANPRGTVPERLQYLFQVLQLPGEGPFSAAEVARWINDAGGEQISSVYILKILRGERQPSIEKLRLLARFFGVPMSFLLDEDPPALDVDALIAQLLQRRITADPQALLTKIAQLSPATQAALNGIIDNLLLAEGRRSATDGL